MGEVVKEAPGEDQGTLNSPCVFECSIEVDKHSSLKNRKVIGYRWRRGFSPTEGARKVPFLRTESKTKLAQELLVSSLQDRARIIGMDKPLGMALHVVWRLELNNYLTKKGRLNRKAGDLTNLIQNCEDALIKAGIIEDDSLIVKMSALKLGSLDGKNRISVRLFSVNNVDDETAENKAKY